MTECGTRTDSLLVFEHLGIGWAASLLVRGHMTFLHDIDMHIGFHCIGLDSFAVGVETLWTDHQGEVEIGSITSLDIRLSWSSACCFVAQV